MLTNTDRRARVLVVSLGGTIASTTAQSAHGVVPQLTAQDLVDSVPGLHEVADIETLSFRQVPSGDITLDDVVALSRLIRDRLKDGVDGVVVTQGTDTIEETSFTLDVLLDGPSPIVVTGAMRNPTQASPDGPGNVLAAVKVAASPDARGLGCVVVMNDLVHAARFVRKTHTSSLATFQSPSCGPLGWVKEERVRVVLRPNHLARISLDLLKDVPRVALITCAIGDDGRTLRTLAASGYRGTVIEGFGAGHVPGVMAPDVENLVAQMPVVLCSRTGAGEVLDNTYGFVGSETDLLSRGVISGGSLDARKSRVALTVALAASVHREHAIEQFVHVRDSVV
ncbi:MAG: asparaginase [Acidimicrobiaceae bacterium]|nr:asparaginase [Acidimicrobiaceae bacterium]